MNYIDSEDGHCTINWNHEIIKPFTDPQNPNEKNLIYCRRCDIIFKELGPISRAFKMLKILKQ